MLCVLCLITIGFVQCYSLGCWKFLHACVLVYFSVNFCYACFASQTSGLCSAFPSVPKVFCPLVFVLLFSKFCYACFASQTSGLCSAFPSLPVIFWQACFVLSSKFCYACFDSQTTVCAVFLDSLGSG